MLKLLVTILVLLNYTICEAQIPKKDTTITYNNRVISMPMVVVRSKLNVSDFMQYVQADTSFYKAFKNLKIVGFTAINDVKMRNKKGEVIASLNSTTKQIVYGKCRNTVVLQEATTGDYYNSKHQYNYTTADMYASLLFAIPQKCGEDNIVGNGEVSTKGLSGIEKHKAQLKTLFFNPSKKINGVPLMGDKASLFGESLTNNYDNNIDYEMYQNINCYKFSMVAKTTLNKSERGNMVIDEMTTWFNTETMQIMGRNYSLSYNAGVYDFNVQMQVEMTTYNGLTVPSLIRYIGNWDVAFKKRERGVFTAILYNFTGK